MLPSWLFVGWGRNTTKLQPISILLGLELGLSISKCDYRCSTKVDMESHLKEKHTSIRKISCIKCSYNCQNEEELKKHVEDKHTPQQVYACLSCDYVAKVKSDLLEHGRLCHDNTTTNQENQSRPCNPADPDHTSECCDRKPGQIRPIIYSPEEKNQNGICLFWNRGYCRFSDLCKNLHKEIPRCYHDENCRRTQCKFYHHDSSKNTFLGWKTTQRSSNYSYQEEDFPPLNRPGMNQ